MAYLSGYSKYKVLTLTGGASGAQTDFQLKLAVPYAAAMQGDFDDIRFTQADGTTLVDAWAEAIVTDTSAAAWVEFPTTPANTVEQIYRMYYGNAGAANYWDGAATFIDFFGFDSYNNGDLNGQDGWVKSGNTHTIQSTIAKHGTKSVVGQSNDLKDYHSVTAQTTGIATIWMRATATDREGYFVLSDRNTWFPNGLIIALQDDGHFKYLNSSGSWANLTTDTTYIADTWYKVEVAFNTTTDRYVSVKIDDVEKMSDVACQSIDAVDYLWLRTYTGASVYYDTPHFRKYAANPPTYEFGAEQSVPTGHPTMRRWGGIPGMQYTGRRSW